MRLLLVLLLVGLATAKLIEDPNKAQDREDRQRSGKEILEKEEEDRTARYYGGAQAQAGAVGFGRKRREILEMEEAGDKLEDVERMGKGCRRCGGTWPPQN